MRPIYESRRWQVIGNAGSEFPVRIIDRQTGRLIRIKGADAALRFLFLLSKGISAGEADKVIDNFV